MAIKDPGSIYGCGVGRGKVCEAGINCYRWRSREFLSGWSLVASLGE